MINITPFSTECVSLLTTESEATASTTTPSTVSSSLPPVTTSTSTTIASLTDNLCPIDNSIDRVPAINSSIVNSCSQADEDNYSIIEALTTATTINTTTSSTQTSTNIENQNISIDSDSNDSIAVAIPAPSATRDISCIDLTEADEDEIEIIKEKLTVRPHKKRKREKTSTSTTTSCCSHRPCRSSLRESSASLVRSVSLSPRSVHHRTSFHHHHPLTPPLPPLIPIQEPLRISPPRSDSFIVDLANSPSPSTSSSSNKNIVIDKLVESVPKRKNIVEQPQEPVRYKIVRCPICLEEDHKILAGGGEIVVTICGHVYCKSCLHQAIKTNHCCPNCRRKLTQRNYHRIFL